MLLGKTLLGDRTPFTLLHVRQHVEPRLGVTASMSDGLIALFEATFSAACCPR